MDDDSLTTKQLLFCKEYLANGYNSTQAAIEAGYSERCAKEIGAENLTKPAVKAYIEKRLNKVKEKLDITLEWKMNILKQCAEGCLNGKADKDGLIHAAGTINSIAELNKMQGHYEPERKEINHKSTQLESLIDKYEREF